MATNYFFPSFLNSLEPVSIADVSALEYSVESGKKALQLLLRSFELPANSTVALPAFVCESVAEAVETEGFVPLLLDLKNDFSFWTDYDFEKIKGTNCKAIILVHLYGFIHPDTKIIVEFCKQNSIFLIQDAAQSYGIDKEKIKDGNGIVYSFGPGKSTTAAGGAIIENCNATYYDNHVTQIENHFIQKNIANTKSKLFLKSRIYGFSFSRKDKLLNRIVSRFSVNNVDSKIFSMTDYQRKIAASTIHLLKRNLPLRKVNYHLLTQAIQNNQNFLVPYQHDNGLCFKCIVFVKSNVAEFKKYLLKNNVPYYILFSENDVAKYSSELKYFSQNATHFFEFSSEASIPEMEIKRVANLLAEYK